MHDYNANHHFWDDELGTSYFTCVNMVCMSVLVGITELYRLLILKYICIGAVPCEYMNWNTSHLLGVCFVSNCWVAFLVLHICLHFENKMNEFFSCDGKMYELVEKPNLAASSCSYHYISVFFFFFRIVKPVNSTYFSIRYCNM